MKQIIGGFHRKEAHTVIHLDADRNPLNRRLRRHGGFPAESPVQSPGPWDSQSFVAQITGNGNAPSHSASLSFKASMRIQIELVLK